MIEQYKINTTILKNKSIRLEQCIDDYIAAQRTQRLQHLVTDKGVKIIRIENNDNKIENYNSIGGSNGNVARSGYQVSSDNGSNNEGVEGGVIASNKHMTKSNGKKETETTHLLG